jgi:hypothetical protein
MDDAMRLTIERKRKREKPSPQSTPHLGLGSVGSAESSFSGRSRLPDPSREARACRGSDPAPLATPFFIRASSSVLLPTILLFILAKAKQSGQPVQPWHMQPPSFHLIHHLLAFPLVLRPSDFLVAIPTRSDAFSAQPDPRYARCEPAAGA